MQLASFSLGDNLNKLVHSQGQLPFARRSYSHYADGKQLKACLEEFAFGHTVVFISIIQECHIQVPLKLLWVVCLLLNGTVAQ